MSQAPQTQGARSSLVTWTMGAVLWGGIVLCVLAAFRGMRSVSANGFHFPVTWVLLIIVPSVTWGLAVAGWRQLVAAYTGEMPGWLPSFRQSGLLLVGKYVPGGVFGFLARLHDANHFQRSSHLAAGLVEQLLGILAPTIVGAICYFAAITGVPLLLLLLLATPFIVAAGAMAAAWFARLLRRNRIGLGGREAPGRIVLAAAFFCVQQVAWVGLASWIAGDVSSLSALDAVGVGGCFGLAITVGMLIVLVPGGIGVREGALVALALPWMDSAHAVVVASVMRLASVCLDMLAGLTALALRRATMPLGPKF